MVPLRVNHYFRDTPVPSNRITGIGGFCFTAVMILVTVAGLPSKTIIIPNMFSEPVQDSKLLNM